MRDIDVRAALLRRLHDSHSQDDTRVVEEMGIWSGSARIDVAVINGELSGYELKSDRDSLARLPSQVDIYNKVFDRVTLVVGPRHAAKATAIIPDWWGVLSARPCATQLSLHVIKRARKNKAIDPSILVQLLCKSEVLEILDRLGLAEGWRSKSMRAVQDRLVNHLPLRLLRLHVRSALKTRSVCINPASQL